MNSKDRRVELNWIGPKDGPEENDWVGLFKSRPNETAAKRDKGRYNSNINAFMNAKLSQQMFCPSKKRLKMTASTILHTTYVLRVSRV